MKALANYIMKGRVPAIIACTGFSVFSLLFPPLSYLSGAVISLVTLRVGSGQGLVLAILSTLMVGGLTMAFMGSGLYAMVVLVAVWLPVWIVSTVLRQTVSLNLALLVAVGMALLAIIAFHLAIPDTEAFWKDIISKFLAESGNSVPEIRQEDVIESTVPIATAALGATFLLSTSLCLFLGRWWQALLYNPGGFGKEFRELQVNKVFAMTTLAVVTAAMLMSELGGLLSDLSVVMIAYCAIGGLALFHDWVEKTKANTIWLIVVYVFLLFAAPQMLTVLAMIGIGDSWGNLRQRIKKGGQP
ncbi:MAG: hypothetical protein OEX00_10675 [Gammaproteobacteria bacterium]|nr:hypothetical protein [Gammaproteobacteria bacterium]MDH5692151.1 hypothetical protein [Gammaproteobacteria bacterium]